MVGQFEIIYDDNETTEAQGHGVSRLLCVTVSLWFIAFKLTYYFRVLSDSNI